MKIFKFKHYKKNLDWGGKSYNISDLETFDQDMSKGLHFIISAKYE
jgi:hypothetical protein